MDDVQPSLSKKAGSKDGKDDNESGHKTNTDSRSSYFSWPYSDCSRSQVEKEQAGLDIPKPVKKIQERYTKENEKSKRHTGGVNKGKRYTKKRHVSRRAPKRKPQNRGERKKRDNSISTIFTRLSSDVSGNFCRRCGHRYYERRSEYSFNGRNHRRYDRSNRKKMNGKDLRSKNERAIKRSMRHVAGAANQAGSRARMLSPLFIKSNDTLDEQQQESHTYCEVTPQMIYEAVKNLSMWKQEVKTTAILEYIKNHYPVDPDSNVLLKDLVEKLRIAALVGIVTQLLNDSWCLPNGLQKQSLAETHVTLFWQAYGDTMKPVTKAKTMPEAEKNNKEQQLNIKTDSVLLLPE